MPRVKDQEEQLRAIGAIAAALDAAHVVYWLFGGWAVDFHAGRMTRPHDDIDVAVWADEFDRASAVLVGNGWERGEEAGDGYVVFRRGEVRLELAFVDRERRDEWPADAFGNDVGSVDGVAARVIARGALIADKSVDYGDPATAAKDQVDVAILRALAP
jgi:hypothetical protein